MPCCEGHKCHVCKMTGELAIKVAQKIPIQRAHIITKYVAENLHEVAQELTLKWGLVHKVNIKKF